MIRDSRSRPCSQNILEFLNRGGEFTLDMETLRITLDGLMERSIIYNGGKGERESLYITHPDQDNNNSENTIGENSEYFKRKSFIIWLKILLKIKLNTN